MKKIALVVLLCVLFINAQAQKPFTFGPMVGSGFNIAKADLSGVSAKANGNFLGGAFARISIKRFYIQPELYYSNKVANLTLPTISLTTGQEVKQQYKTGNFNVNALVGVKLLKLSGLFNLRVFAGPSTSLIVAKKMYYDGAKSSLNNLKSQSYNIQAGLGIDVTKLTLDVRYEQGLSDITTTPDKLKINSVMVVVGFKIL